MNFCKNIEEHRFSNRQLQAVGQKNSYWDIGQIITVSFIGGNTLQRSNIQTVLNELMTFVNLKFQIVPSNGMIRIAFNSNDGSWSYIGKEALGIPKNQPTLNIGWSGLGVIRHEMGHAIGMLHEHQSPDHPIQWNKPAVIKDLSGAPNYWSVATITSNVFDRYDEDDVDSTDLDKDSSLMYQIPVTWTLDGFHSEGSDIYSPVDIAFLKMLYPFEITPPIEPPVPPIDPVIPDYTELFKRIFLTKSSLKANYEGVIVRIGKEIGVGTDSKLNKNANIKLVADKLGLND